MSRGIAVLLAVATTVICASSHADVSLDYGTVQVYIGKGYILSNPVVYAKTPNQQPKIVKQFMPFLQSPKLLAPNEDSYYTRQGRSAPAIHFNDVLIINGSRVWVYQASGVIQRLGVDGSKIKEWSGRWVTIAGNNYFLFSIMQTDGTTATYKQLATTMGSATLIDDKFRPLISNLNSTDDISDFFATEQRTHYRWFARQTGIERLTEIEDRSQNLIRALDTKIYGQDRLIDGLARLYKMSLMNPQKKVYTSIMMGPSGTGKTYAAEMFARQVFGSDNYVLKIDGTEYQQGLSNGGMIEIHKLVGAPSGQQGQQKGAITEWLKATGGNGVLIINEGDKMHPDIWMRLMELLDRGEITAGDGKKYTANFLYIIVTTNRGAKKLFPRSVKNWSDDQLKARVENLTSADLKELYETAVDANDKKVLPREVINRIDEWLLSQPFSDSPAIGIARDEANVFQAQMRKLGLHVEIQPDVIEYLALTNFTANDDGRQIRRAVKTNLTNLFAEIGKGQVPKSDMLTVSLVKGERNQMYIRAVGHDVDVKILGPQATNKNPLYDPQTVARLKAIPQVLAARVMGQPEAVKSVSEALIAKLGQAENDRATSFFFVGTSGNGKTEMGRAIAEAAYGSIDRSVVIPLGEVQNDPDFNKVFGVQPGYMGSDQTRLFEDALAANPDGGVIIFDEASNMGGGDKYRKAELFKKLYNIVEEKTWASPVNGKTYDLGKYVFVFTGNDGEEYFQGITSDDMLMKQWETYKPREKVRELLLNDGIPQAFINRMADAILFKPNLAPEAHAITQKLFGGQVSRYENANAGVNIEFDDQFINRLAASFFTLDKGGRSIRDLTEHRLKSLLTMALIEHGIPEQGFDSIKVKLELNDNGRIKSYRFANSPNRTVEIVARVTDASGRESKLVIDLTEFASTRMLMDAREAMATAFHEAGHAVVNDPELTGQTLGYVTIRGGRAKDVAYLGYARYELLPGRSGNPTRQSALAMIAQLSAGRIAQTMAGYPEDAGYSNDLEKIRRIATEYFTKWGLDEDMQGIRTNDKGELLMTPEQSALLNQKMNKLIDDGKALARSYLEQNWDLVRAVAAAIFHNNGSLDGAQFLAIQNSVFSRVNRKPFNDYIDNINRHKARRVRKSRLNSDRSCSQILSLGDIIR